MESQLIRILPACLTGPLPKGWDASSPEYLVEVMPSVDQSAGIVLALPTTEPDILLIDADFEGADMFEVASAALKVRPELAVVMLSSDSAPERLRKAMFAGAEEYLIKPLDGPALRASLVGIAQHRTLRIVTGDEANFAPEDHAQGLVVGVMSGKGGLGKTTLAANMAAIVAQATGKTAGLIALEAGDGAVLLNLSPKLGLFDLSTAEANQRAEGGYTVEWMSQFSTPHKSGLNYLQWEGSGSIQPEGIPDDFLSALFNTCRRAQSVTFVDFGLLTPDEAIQMFPMLDVILVVSSSSDLLALRATKTFLDLIPEELAPRVRVIVNRSDPNDMISREDYEMALEDRHKIAAVLPNEPQVAAQAINMGSPFVLTQPTSELATTVRQLAQVLFRLPVETEQAKPKRRFMLFG